MKITSFSGFLGAALGLALLSTPADAAVISINDSASFGMPRTWSPGGNTITQAQIGAFDPSGSDKLIVTLGYRSSGDAGFSGVTYNGMALTEAVQHITFEGITPRQTTGIFYLDNPGAAGDLVISTNASGFGFATSLLAVSGTADGVGNISSGQSSTTSLTVDSGSLVVAQNAVSGETIPSAQSPLIGLLSHAITGSQSSSHASGYVNDPGAGTFDPTFSVGSNPSIVAAEFLAIPEPSTALLSGIGLLALLCRRRR